MIDSHIHLGQFNDLYSSPKELLRFLDSVGVDLFAVSSTTTCERNFSKVLAEIKEMIELAGSRALPVLWIVPEMFEGAITGEFLSSGIGWRMLKMHPQTSPAGSWEAASPNTKNLVALAKRLNLPVLIHTGEMDGCYPLQFHEVIRDNPEIKFILAHGRPIDQTIKVMQSYPNVWCDTAFMPTENIVKLCNCNLSGKVLWGTDYPIPRYFYPNRNMVDYYLSLLSDLRLSVTAEDFSKITEDNFTGLFNL